MRSLVFTLLVTGLLARVGLAQDYDSRPPSGGTVVPGGSVSGTWTKAGSPYFVLGDIVVGTLVVEAGVQVRSAPQVEIRVVAHSPPRARPRRPCASPL